jgi:hypothetical protein
VTRRRGTRRDHLPDDLKKVRVYWKLQARAPDRSVWRTRFGGGYGPVVRQIKEWEKNYGICESK